NITVSLDDQNIIISGATVGLATEDFVTQTYATISNLFQTGLTLSSRIFQISGASGVLQLQIDNLTSNIFSTGLNLQNQINNLSEDLYETGQNLYPRTNPSGFVDENYVETVSGFLASLISSSSAGVSTLNGLSGIIDIVGAGNITIS